MSQSTLIFNKLPFLNKYTQTPKNIAEENVGITNRNPSKYKTPKYNPFMEAWKSGPNVPPPREASMGAIQAAQDGGNTEYRSVTVLVKNKFDILLKKMMMPGWNFAKKLAGFGKMGEKGWETYPHFAGEI